MEETWVDIPEFEGCYQVSNMGRVRSLDRTIIGKDRRRRTVKGKVLLGPISNTTGYRSVTLRDANKDKYKVQWVHILVCEAFHGPKPTDKHEVAHKDDNKLNNVWTNLRWTTRKGNMDDQRRNGRLAIGTRHGNAILNEENVHSIRLMHTRGVTVAEIARTFDVDWKTIKDVVEGKTWRHLIG